MTSWINKKRVPYKPVHVIRLSSGAINAQYHYTGLDAFRLNKVIGANYVMGSVHRYAARGCASIGRRIVYGVGSRSGSVDFRSVDRDRR